VTVKTESGSRRFENGLKVAANRAEVFVDEQTGRQAWPALTCNDPACPHNAARDGPLVFVYPVPATGVDEDGNLVVPDSVPLSRRRPRCPECGKSEHVSDYVLPETARRRDRLDAEIEAARAALRRSGGKKMPEGVRSPIEILRERAQLPELYLIPNE
jgi:hypothetical protein